MHKNAISFPGHPTVRFFFLHSRKRSKTARWEGLERGYRSAVFADVAVERLTAVLNYISASTEFACPQPSGAAACQPGFNGNNQESPKTLETQPRQVLCCECVCEHVCTCIVHVCGMCTLSLVCNCINCYEIKIIKKH